MADCKIDARKAFSAALSRRLCGIDERSLFALRILLSLFCLWDVYNRLSYGTIDLALYYATPPTDFDGDTAGLHVSPLLPSVLHPDDTPHKAPLHRLWFYRGSRPFQVLAFVVLVVLSLLFGHGKCNYNLVSKILWFVEVGVQNRNMYVHDGSDRYLRCLLLWCSLIPEMAAPGDFSCLRVQEIRADRIYGEEKKMEDGGSVPPRDPPTHPASRKESDGALDEGQGLRRRVVKSSPSETAAATTSPSSSSTPSLRRLVDQKASPSTATSSLSSVPQRKSGERSHIISTVATLGLRLQVVLMYTGTVLNRVSGTTWLPPQLSAVHYALSSTFASRGWTSNLIRRYNPTSSRVMTAQAMLIEFVCPLCCFFLGSGRNGASLVPAFCLVMLHGGLLATTRLPQWQVLGMMANVIWIPTQTWDQWERGRTSGPLLRAILSLSYHSRGRAMNSLETLEGASGSANSQSPSSLSKMTHRLSCYSLLCYMVYNYAGEQGWVGKHDGGDIGEAIQFSQHWVMYGPDAPTLCTTTTLTGVLGHQEEAKEQSADVASERKDAKSSRRDHNEGRIGGNHTRIDILRAFRTGRWDESSFIDANEYRSLRYDEQPEDMSGKFPSWRWENLFTRLGKEGGVKRYGGGHVGRAEVLRAKRLARFFCHVGNQRLSARHHGAVHYASTTFWSERGGATDRVLHSITHVEVAWRGLRINSMDEKERFSRYPLWDQVYEVECS